MTGTTRASSTSATTGAAPGREDSPPTSIDVGPLRRQGDAAGDGAPRYEA